MDPVIYSGASTCGNGSLPWTPRKTGWNKSPFLPFILSEAKGFLNSPARTDVPAQTSGEGQTGNGFSITGQQPNPETIRWIKATDHEVAPVCGTQDQFIRTRKGPSRFLRSPITASISASVRTTWGLTPPTEIPPYLRGGGAKVWEQNKSVNKSQEFYQFSKEAEQPVKPVGLLFRLLFMFLPTGGTDR